MLWSDFDRFGSFLDPWREFERMRRSLSRAALPANGEFPAVNIWSAPDDAVVTTEIPGIDPGDIEISVAGKTLTVKGSRRQEEVAEGETYHRRERWYGQFTRTFELPFSVEQDKVKARFSKGVLTIELPRAEKEKPKKIEIKSE